jgi:hypothetical protein
VLHALLVNTASGVLVQIKVAVWLALPVFLVNTVISVVPLLLTTKPVPAKHVPLAVLVNIVPRVAVLHLVAVPLALPALPGTTV